MTPVSMFYLPDAKYGGWATYTAHLYHGLRAAGYEPTLYRVGRKTELGSRSWGRNIQYRNLSLFDACMVAHKSNSIITATAKAFAVETEALLKAGARIVIHDPTELTGDIPTLLTSAKDVITIRPINVDNLAKHGVTSRYVPHPYVRMPHQRGRRMLWAASFSRIDWDKGTHHIVAANDKLPANKQVRIYGAENRMYAHHKLPEHWTKYWAGQFPADDLWAATRIAARYKWCVDMSTIKGDGGGTQYTFLEAADAGTALMLNEGWRTDRDDDEISQYATYVNPEQLHEALLESPTIDPEPLLHAHNAKLIAEQVME